MLVRLPPGRGPAWTDLKTWAAGLVSCPFCESVVVLAAMLFLGLASLGLPLCALGLAVERMAVGSPGEGLSRAALAMLADGAAGFMLDVILPQM